MTLAPVTPNLLDDLGSYLAEAMGGPWDQPLQRLVWLGWLPEGPSASPPAPDACVALMELEGLPPIRSLDSGAVGMILQPGLQAAVRGAPNDYAGCRGMAQAVHDLLGGISNQVIGGNFYLVVRPAHAPIYVGRDAMLRTGFQVDFDVQMRRLPPD